MKLKNLKYRFLKAQNYMRNNSLFFIFTTDKSHRLIKAYSTLINWKIYYLSLKASFLKVGLKASIYQNLRILLTNNIYFVSNRKLDLVKKINSCLLLVGLVLNKTFYNITQIKNLEYLSYKKYSLNLIIVLQKVLQIYNVF